VRAFLRGDAWQRRAAWARGVGLVLLLVTFFLPLPATALVAVLAAGLAVFLFGAFAWLLHDTEPWLRRG